MKAYRFIVLYNASDNILNEKVNALAEKGYVVEHIDSAYGTSCGYKLTIVMSKEISSNGTSVMQ